MTDVITAKKKKEVVEEEVVEEIIDETYVQQELSTKDEEASKFLQSNFDTFLNDTMGMGEEEEECTLTIPTGIDLLDTILGGGVATKFSQFVGLPGAGKSSLVARILAMGQRKWPGKFLGIYIDSECAMSKERLAELGVNDTDPKSNDITIEKVFKYVEGMCAFKEQNKEYMDIPFCIIWDSVANTLPEKGLEVEKHHSIMGLKAAVLSHFLPKYVNKLNKYRIALVAINQLRDNLDLGMGGSPADLRLLAKYNIPGGKSLLFNSSQLIFMRQTKILEDEYGFDGCIVYAKTVKNKLFSPNIEVNLVFSFTHGFSNFWTNYELLKQFKRISAGGGWVKMKGYDSTTKFRQKQAMNKYKEDAAFRKAWDDNVADVLDVEFISKAESDKSQTEVW